MLMVFSVSAFAADAYPSKSIRLVVGFAAGSTPDIIARLVTPGLSERLGRQVVVENRAGDGGTIGAEVVARSAPDGYTIGTISDSFLFKPALGEKLPFDTVKAFTPISLLGFGWNVLAVHPSVPAKNVQEFIALLKQKPGELICMASGNASVSHMVSELFKLKTGTNFKTLQFQGSGPGVIDLVGGHCHFGFISLTTAKSNADAGKLRLLAVMGSERSPLTPDVPIISEVGVPGVMVDNWWGLVAPSGLPQPILDRLGRDLKVVLEDPKTKEAFLKAAAVPVYNTPKELGDYIVSEIAQWTDVAKAAGMKIER